jgi:GNAT superfamily N-acetyltransferase
MVSILPYTPALEAAALAAYSAWTHAVPHCPPVSLEAWSVALAPTCGAAPSAYADEGAFLAVAGDDVVGLAHVALIAAREVGLPPSGALRFFAYSRGQRAAGVALLAQADAWLNERGALDAVAMHYDHRLPFYHLPHMYLSDRMDHVHALLGACGWQPGQIEVALDWPDYTPDPRPPEGLEVTLTARQETMPDSAPGYWGCAQGTVLLAHQGEREVGVCVAGPLAGEPGWIYTRWLGVAEDLRGRGLGCYLLHASLAEMRAQGYRHAAIGCIGDNYPALLLYTNTGYRAVDWTTVREKTLAPAQRA